MEINKMWDMYPEIKEDLEEVLTLILKNIKCKDKNIEKAIKDMINSGGKLLRPAFSIIASRFGEHDREKSIAVAGAIETLHMATLVHDDVIDDSHKRRGQQTLQSKFGKDYAVYIGDYLFCVCFKLLATHSSSLASIKIDTKTMERICLGEIDQMNDRFVLDTSVKNYLGRVSGKTAELFALSFYSGASESGCSDKMCRIFWQIGHNIGMAFQIIDDILDYSSDSKTIGKPAAMDIKQGIFNLPLIYAIDKDRKHFTELLTKEVITDEDVSTIIDMVNKHKGVEKAIATAEKYTTKAYKMIGKLPDNPYKKSLLEITEKLLSRRT